MIESLICNRCGAEDLETDNLDKTCQVCHQGTLVPVPEQTARFNRAVDFYDKGYLDRREGPR